MTRNNDNIKLTPKSLKNSTLGERRKSNDEKFGYLPSFSKSKTKDSTHTAYNSDLYVVNLGRTVSDLTAAGYFADACVAAVERNHQKGNMKDKVAAQETAFGALCQYWIMVLGTLGPMRVVKDLFKNPPESNTVTSLGDGETGNTNIANYEFLTWNSILSELEGKMIPEMVLRVFKKIHFVIKFSEPYQQFAVDIPAMYGMLYTPYLASATVDTYIDNIYSNQGLAQRHMDKFGIKYTKFSRSMIDDYPTYDYRDKNILPIYFHFGLVVRGNAVNVSINPTGDPAAGTHSTRKYFFESNPNESDLNVLLPILASGYHATNNPYGGILSDTLVSTTREDISGWIGNEVETTEFLATDVRKAQHFVALFHCLSDVTGGEFNLSWTGDAFAADRDLQYDLMFPYLFYGSGLTQSIMETAFIRWLGEGV